MMEEKSSRLRKHSRGELQQYQSLPLEAKIRMTQRRIEAWMEMWKRYEVTNLKTGKKRYITDTEEPSERGHWIERIREKDGKEIVKKELRKGSILKPNEDITDIEDAKVYCSRSGGKDSDVLGHIIKRMGLDIPHIFVNTGLEDRTVRKHGEEVADRVIKPNMPPQKVLIEYGYPIISKDVAQCIYSLQVARDKGKNIENLYRMKKIKGLLKIAEAYGKVVYDGTKFHTTGCKRTGCIYCFFGIMEEKDRIAKLQLSDPQLADYIMRGGEFGEDGYWKPSKEGLGYWFVIEWLNIYGLGIKTYRDTDYIGVYGNEKTRRILLAEKIKVSMKKSG